MKVLSAIDSWSLEKNYDKVELIYCDNCEKYFEKRGTRCNFCTRKIIAGKIIEVFIDKRD